MTGDKDKEFQIRGEVVFHRKLIINSFKVKYRSAIRDYSRGSRSKYMSSLRAMLRRAQ